MLLELRLPDDHSFYASPPDDDGLLDHIQNNPLLTCATYRVQVGGRECQLDDLLNIDQYIASTYLTNLERLL